MTASKIIFDAEKHEYKLNNQVLISVTQLLKKHGLIVDYSQVDAGTLTKKAERGKIIHRELENYIKTGDSGFTKETQLFAQWMKEQNIMEPEPEKIIYNDILAGTIDLKLILNKKNTLIDYKTSAKLDKEGARWQLSLYNFLLNDWAEELKIVHFPTSYKMKITDISPILKEEIERLIECERNGEIYTKQNIVITENLLMQLEEFEIEIKKIEERKKALEEKVQSYHETLMNAMTKANIKKWTTPSGVITFTYIDSGFRTTIDTTALKKELPEIAEKYSKQTPFKASLRVKVED